MDRLPLVVSFYTVETPYEKEAQRLIASCNKFGIEHLIEGVRSSGSWELNCAFKPLFLLKKLEELNRPLLWVDVDAIFLQPLVFSEVFVADVGVRLYNCPDDHPSRIVSSLVFLNATDKAKEIARLWAHMCLSMLQKKDRKEEVWDQDALRRILFLDEHKASWKAFPDGYSIIEGHPDDEIYSNPIIVQGQASRFYKKWINDPDSRIFELT